MNLKISSSFANDFKTINDVSLSEKIKSIVESIKTAENVYVLTQFKSISGNNKAYKMGIGFYFLIGVLTAENEITLMRLLHRDEVIKVLNT